MTEIDLISPAETHRLLEAGEIVLIDVRNPPEFMIEHIEGALLMPMVFFRADRLPSQEGKRIVLHCGSGMRSGRMAEAMREAGLSPIAHMDGGFAAWKAAELPYIGTDMASGAPIRKR